MERAVLVRFSEIALKSPRVRRWMMGKLRRNILSALHAAGVGGGVEERWERLYIVSDDIEKAIEAASRVFGVKSLSPAWVIEYGSFEELIEKAAEYVGGEVRGKSFAVRARRDKDLPFTSMDVMRVLGDRLREWGGRVDLERPDVTVQVEVRGRRAYLFTEVVGGPGGLPIGTQGRALSLLSGGFDSAVSSWYIMRRGAEVDYVTFSLAGPLQMRDALLVADLLVRMWSHGYRPTMYLVNFAEVLTEIEGRVRRPLQGVVLRHLFYRAAEMLAGKYGHLALVTGESLGQVSSQTLQNLHAASGGISLPILRPLLGMDKEEIISQAKRIGTADISSHVVEYCAITGGGNVSVKRREIEDALDELDLDTITKAVERVRIVHLPGETEKVLKELEKEIEDWRWSEGESHEGVVFVNYRGGVQVSLPEGFPLDEEEVKNAIRGGLRGSIRSLPREFRYVFSCPTGGWAMRMVEALRTYGYNAYYTS